MRPGLIAAGYFGTAPGTPFLAALIEGIRTQPSVADRQAWVSVGPLYLTRAWAAQKYANLTILPSHFFMPRHHTGQEYTGKGPVFSLQAWASTQGTYESLATPVAITQMSAEVRREAVSQAFLLEPTWEERPWRQVVLSYLEAFTAEDPVVLILLVDPSQPNQIPWAKVEQSILEAREGAGRGNLPEVLLLDRPGDILSRLRPFQQISWLRPSEGGFSGLRGPLALRLVRALGSMTKDAPK
jgi:hypothetical protein